MCYSLPMKKMVQGYEGMYEVDDEGVVYSLKYGEPRVMRTHLAGTRVKYKAVTLHKDGAPKKFLVHRLVCAAFHGEPEEGQEVRHLDGDSFHNHQSNLRWGTRSENMMDSVRHGTHSSNREKTHCKQGHEFTPENTLYRAANKNARHCRTCLRNSKNAWYARKKAEREAGR